MNASTITALMPILKGSFYYVSNRNFLPFDGKPMYQYMIEKLLAVTQIEKIVINTDAEEIKEFYRTNEKILIVDRPDEFIDEYVASDLITAYTLEKVKGEHFIEIQSFNPLLTINSIGSAIDQYFQYIEEGYFDSVFSMQRHESRAYDLDKRALIEEFPFVIFENRILNVFNRTNFKKQGNKKVGKSAMMYEIKEVEHTLVDSDTNYQLAKLVFENKEKFPNVFY